MKQIAPGRWLCVCILAALLLSACSISQQATEQRMTLPPSSTPLPPTPVKTATLTPIPAPQITPLPVSVADLAGQTVRTLCLEVRQATTPGGETLPAFLADEAAQILEANGMQVVRSASDCDASLRIVLYLQAVSANYSGKWCYTGSNAQGTMTLTARDGAQVKKEIEGGISTPFAVTSCPASASAAPLNLALSLALMDGFSQLWGFDFLANVIRRADVPQLHRSMAAEQCSNSTFHEQQAVIPCLLATAETLYDRRSTALSKLESLGADGLPAVPGLINLLEPAPGPTPTVDNFNSFPLQGNFQEDVVAALKAITGQDFGLDTARWRAWWNTASLALTVTPMPCSEYQNSIGKVVQVSGKVDYVETDENGTWIELLIGECGFSIVFWIEEQQNVDPALLAAVKEGAQLTLTGEVTDWHDGWTFIDGVSILSVQPGG